MGRWVENIFFLRPTYLQVLWPWGFASLEFLCFLLHFSGSGILSDSWLESSAPSCLKYWEFLEGKEPRNSLLCFLQLLRLVVSLPSSFSFLESSCACLLYCVQDVSSVRERTGMNGNASFPRTGDPHGACWMVSSSGSMVEIQRSWCCGGDLSWQHSYLNKWQVMGWLCLYFSLNNNEQEI